MKSINSVCAFIVLTGAFVLVESKTGAKTPSVPAASQISKIYTDLPQISGKVLTSEGSALSGINVLARDTQGKIAGVGTTNEDGKIDNLRLADGTYDFEAMLAGQHLAVLKGVTVNNGKAEAIVVKVPSGQVTGIITDENGLPISSAIVYVVSSKFGHASTKSDNSGKYLLQYLPSGTVSLSVMVEGYKPLVTRDVVVKEGTRETMNLKITSDLKK